MDPQAVGLAVLTKHLYKINEQINTCDLSNIHTLLLVHYAYAAANLNSGYSKYSKVAYVHYFCTIALPTPYTHVSIA